MANSSNVTDDLSFLGRTSTDTMDGVTTNDASIEYVTRGQAQKTLASVDKVKKWLDSPEEQEQLQLEAVDPILGFISNDPLIARGIYNASDFKSRLTEFIAEGQREAKELEKRLARANIDIKSTKMISFSKVNKEYLEEEMNVSFYDAAAQFQAKVLHQFLNPPKISIMNRSIPTNAESALTKHSGIFRDYWNMDEEAEGDTKDKPDEEKTTDLATITKRYTFFLKWLDLTMYYAPHSVEAGSRRIIDAILLGLTDTLHSGGYHEAVPIPELKVRRNATCPIFTISASSNKPLRHVILSGSVDYAFVTRAVAVTGATPSVLTMDLIERLQINSDVSTLFGDMAPTLAPKLRVLFIEAKRPSPNLNPARGRGDPITWLKSHEGQAVAEAMASLKYQEDVDTDLTAGDFVGIPWGVTDGVNWVFGVVVHACGTQQWTSYGLGTAKNDRRKESSEKHGLMNLMAILHILTIFDVNSLFKLMGIPVGSKSASVVVT